MPKRTMRHARADLQNDAVGADDADASCRRRIGSALRAAQSSPPTLTRPAPIVGSMSCVTTPSRPMSGSVRDGTPGRARDRPSDAGAGTRATARARRRRRASCAARREAEGRGQRPRRRAPRLTKTTPKCGIETLDDGGDNCQRSPRRRPGCRDLKHESRTIISGTADGRWPCPATASPRSSRWSTAPKQTSSRMRFAAGVTRLACQHPADVRQHDGDEHQR